MCLGYDLWFIYHREVHITAIEYINIKSDERYKRDITEPISTKFSNAWIYTEFGNFFEYILYFAIWYTHKIDVKLYEDIYIGTISKSERNITNFFAHFRIVAFPVISKWASHLILRLCQNFGKPQIIITLHYWVTDVC